MSEVHILQIASKIKETFADELDLSDLSTADKEYEDKVLTRCLAVYAVYLKTGCSVSDAAKSVVDGGDDNGIDAIYHSVNDKALVIVQSKWRKSGKGEPSSSDVQKFCTGINDLLAGNYTRFNSKIQTLESKLTKAIAEYNTKYYLIVIDTCQASSLSEHALRHVEDLLLKFNDIGDDSNDDIAFFERYYQKLIWTSLSTASFEENIEEDIALNKWGNITEPYKAFYGFTDAENVALWWKKYNKRLFAKNIRQVLGSTDVNKEIYTTLVNQPDKFWYYNNGITIIADKIFKNQVGSSTKDIGIFKLNNLSIVNGAQTVSTLGKAYVEEKDLSNVKLFVRIISLDGAPETFGEIITKTNNRQNRIENRDFVSQDQEQKRLRTELGHENINYNIVRVESSDSTNSDIDLLEATSALACASGQIQLAVQAKRGIGKFFENLNSSMYKSIFNERINGYYVYNCVQIERYVTDYLKTKIRSLSKKSGRSYGIYVHGNKLIAFLLFNQIKSYINKNEIISDLNSLDLETKLNEIVNKMDVFIEHEYSGNFLGTLFKNITKCTAIVNHYS